MRNNRFSFLLEQKDIDLQTIVADYLEIKDLQTNTRIKNYFPSIKYAQFLSNRIGLEFKNNEVNADKIKGLIKKFDSVIKDSYINFEWSKDHNFMAFQLPEEESKVRHTENGTEYSFFLASSFVLPLNYEKILQELKEYSRKLEKYKTLLEVHENLTSEKAIIKELRENVSKNDKRSIEILGVFSALVLFASTSVQIFSIKDIHFKDALKFMLCFSYSLNLFIFLVWLITRENIKNVTMTHKIFFFALATVAYLSLAYTIEWWPFNK